MGKINSEGHTVNCRATAATLTRFKCDRCSYRLSEASVLRASLHVEGFDLSWETTQQDGLIDGVCHQPLWSLRDVLSETHTSHNILIKMSKLCVIYIYIHIHMAFFKTGDGLII